MHVEMGWICPIWPSARFATKLAPMCKKRCCLAVPLIKGWKIADFLKNIFFSFFDHFFNFLVISLPFSRCWPYFEAGMLFGGFSSTRVTKSNSGCRENPYFEKLADLRQIWHIHRYRGQIHTCSPGRLQGHLWVILTIGSCFYGSFRLFSVLGSGLLPHTRSKTLKTTVFLTQNTTFWPMKGKK